MDSSFDSSANEPKYSVVEQVWFSVHDEQDHTLWR